MPQVLETLVMNLFFRPSHVCLNQKNTKRHLSSLLIYPLAMRDWIFSFLYLSFRFLDPSKYIIQVWTTGSDALIGELLKQKYRLIMSNYDAW